MNINKIDNTDITTSTILSESTDDTISSDFNSTINKAYTYSDIFEEASRKYNISVELLEAVAMTESSFNPDSVSNAGAMGLMQLMPATADYLGVDNAFDPVQNVMGGAKYLSELLQKYDGNVDLTLAAYNGGMGNVAKYNGIPPFCESYVEKVNLYIQQGVTSPDKTILVNTLSSSGQLMADVDTTLPPVHLSSSINTGNSTEDSLQINTDGYDDKDYEYTSDLLSSEEFAKMIYDLFSNESSKTSLTQLEMLQSLLRDSDEYSKALSLIDNVKDNSD